MYLSKILNCNYANQKQFSNQSVHLQVSWQFYITFFIYTKEYIAYFKLTLKNIFVKNRQFNQVAGISPCHWKLLSKAIQFKPKDPCKSQTHENLLMKLDALGKLYERSFWDEILFTFLKIGDAG